MAANSRRSVLYALSAVLLWSTVATAFKLSLRELSPIQLLFWANLFSFIALASWLMIVGKARDALPTRNNILPTLSLAVLNPLVYYAILFKAYDLLPAQVAQPVNYTWAFTLALMSVPLLGKRLTRYDILGGLIAYSGVWLLCSGAGGLADDGLSVLGVSLALVSTVIWSGFWILLTRDKRDTEAALCSAFGLSLPLTFAYCVSMDGLSLPSPEGFLGAFWVGLFEMGITFVLWGRAVRYASNVAAISTLIFLSPFLSLIFINFVLDEPVKSSSLAGLAIIVVGLLVQKRGSSGVTVR
ncbi:MAG: DMT family transporter [Planctomycetota bacterium]